MKNLYFLLIFLILGCSNIELKTNAPTHVQNKIRESVVETYTNYEVWELNGKLISYVDVEHCQADYREPIPSQKAFISTLKVKTQKLGGNGLVFDSCLVNKTGACNIHTICRGTAYLITY